MRLCGLFECSCILLVWLVTEVVTHNPKCACISVCSLDRKDRGEKKKEFTFKIMFTSL